MTKIKICGITNLEDALLSVKLGADALGFNFYRKSPRYIAPDDAGRIIAQIVPDVLKVGIFVNETLETIIGIATEVNLDAIQLHGDETPNFCKELGARTKHHIIKAFRVSENFKPDEVLKYDVDSVLLDAFSPNGRGGTGETFDWATAHKVGELYPKLYLAGGLSPENVANAIAEVWPYAVDACSLLESEKGRKDARKLKNFFDAVTKQL